MVSSRETIVSRRNIVTRICCKIFEGKLDPLCEIQAKNHNEYIKTPRIPLLNHLCCYFKGTHRKQQNKMEIIF